jgi:flagellar hook-associated protein 1 FlgK
MPVVPGDSFKIDVRGIIDDNGVDVNAGTNGFGGGSLVQIEFIDADGAILGSALNFAATEGPPTDKVSYSGTIPADAAYVRVKMNSSFRDSSLSNNEGYFNIAVYQGTASETKVARNINSGYNQVVGEFATRANFAEQTADIDSAQVSQIKNKKDSVSGVSLEEEASNLIRFQSAFQAAARVMNVIDRIMEEITNLLR